MEKPHTVLPSGLWFLSWNKKFQNSIISVWDEVPQNWAGEKSFKPTIFDVLRTTQ